MLITGPDGTTATVNHGGRLASHCVTESHIGNHSKEYGNAYSWTTSLNLAGDKCYLYLRNDGDDSLIIDHIGIYAAAAATVELWAGQNQITSAGTAVTGFNLNIGSSNLADVTCTHTETGADAGGTLTLIKTIQCGATNKEIIDFKGALIMPRLGEFAVNVVTDVTLASITIYGFFEVS